MIAWSGRRGVNSILTEVYINSLEAATSRLEDIALAQQSQQIIGNVPGPSGQSAPAAPAAAPTTAGGAASAGSSGAQNDVKVKAFHELIDGPLKKYGELSSDIGGLVAEQVRVSHSFARNRWTAESTA